MNLQTLSPDVVRAFRNLAATFVHNPLGAFTRENSFRHEITKGLNVIRLSESHQLLIALPGVVRHNWHGMAGWPTQYSAVLTDIVLAGSLAVHTFKPQRAALQEILDPETIAERGWLEMKRYRHDSVDVTHAVLQKETDHFDSGEGYAVPMAVPVALSFDQTSPTFVFRHWSGEERELARFSDEGRPADRVDVRYTEDEISRLVDQVAPYLPQ